VSVGFSDQRTDSVFWYASHAVSRIGYFLYRLYVIPRCPGSTHGVGSFFLNAVADMMASARLNVHALPISFPAVSH